MYKHNRIFHGSAVLNVSSKKKREQETISDIENLLSQFSQNKKFWDGPLVLKSERFVIVGYEYACPFQCRVFVRRYSYMFSQFSIG